MYKICKTPKSEARQKEFQDTLLKMLKKQKMKDITIVSLCQEMGISRKTFYQYFDTIEDVLYAMLDKELRAGFLQLEVRPEVEKFFEHWKKQKWLLDILEKNGMSSIIMERVYTIMASSDKLNMYELNSMKNAGWLSAIITVLILWHHGGMEQKPEEMEQLINEMFHLTLSK